MEQRRPISEEVLESINRQQQENTMGKLKIFFGYAAGVGKTYAMLEAAHTAKNNGKDVVVGYIEKHSRPDTLALMEGLEEIPAKQINYKGVVLKEFDIDKVLERKPRLVLVDELAHTNAAGSRHIKRYQDVEEILRAGIDVYSTVNVQHLESLHDLVASITGISVSERIPDEVFDSAAQVEVVDIEPDDLIIRLNEGKIYKERQAKRALNNFFTKDNLAALREIALRRTADRLNRTAQKEGLENTARAGEHILICLSGAPSNARVIRTAARMAEAFHSSFTALYVETSQAKELKGESLKRLKENFHLAEQLGAQISTVYGDEPAVQIAEYAKVSGVTKIVMGRTNHKQRALFGNKNMIDKLTELVNNIDIYIIPDKQPSFKKKYRLFFSEKNGISALDVLKTIGLIILATVIGFIFFTAGMREANIIMVYILGVLITTIVTRGHLCGVISSLLSVIVFNYFFTEPRYTLDANPDYPITFLIMLLTSVISSTLATRVKKQARQASQKAYYTEILMSSNKKLQQGHDDEEILNIGAKQLEALLGRPILYAISNGDNELDFAVEPKDKKEMLEKLTVEETAVAQWVRKNNKHAGATTNTLANADNYYISVRGMQGVMGVVAIPIKGYPELDTFEKNLLIAILNECGIIMERSRLSMEKQQIEMETRQERLRSNLLRAISHDLRTPLTSISGNADVLMEESNLLSENKKQELYHSIYDDAMWLVNLTENLLSITRIDNGTMRLKMEAQLLEEVFDEAMKHVDRRIKDYKVKVNVADDLLMAKMDVRLIMQVIINIVNNAVKYTPAGTEITLSAVKKGKMVSVSISDTGTGIDDDTKKHLFDMFYTASCGKSDDRRGLGLGLNLCRSIITAHGGTISVTDNSPHGSVFTFTLPLEEIKITNEQIE